MSDQAPPIVWPIGTAVRVVPSERHRTVHVGVVRDVRWHLKHACWHYYLRPLRGRMIYTRYLAEDLEAFDAGPDGD